MKIGGIVLVRLNTEIERLVLASLNGASVIDHVLWNIKKIHNLDGIVIAAPDSGQRELITQVAAKHSVKPFFGPESRLERLACAARNEGFDVAVKFAANTPFIDPALSNELIEMYLKKRFDFSCGKGFPAGILPEVVGTAALNRALGGGLKDELKSYFDDKRSNHKTGCLESGTDLESVRLDILSPLDLEVADGLMKKNANGGQSYKDNVAKLPILLAELIGKTDDRVKRKFLNRTLNRLESSMMVEELFSMPTSVRIDAHNLCNINCKTCLNGFSSLTADEFGSSFKSFPSRNIGNIPVFKKHEDGRYVKRPQPMGLKTFKLIRESTFPFLEKISFGVYGEPFLNGDLLKMLEDSKVAGLYTHVLTNGTLLGEKTVTAISEIDVDALTISFDAASPELFEKIRRGANYGAVIGSIKNLHNLKVKKGNEKPHLQFYFTASGENVQELPELVHLAHRTGVDSIYVINRYIGDFMDSADSLYYHKEESARFLREAALNADRLNIDLSMSPLIRYIVDSNVGENDCLTPWSEPYISSVGTVHLCGCSMMASAGNLAELPFTQIWNGSSFKKIRRSLSGRAELFAECKSCLVGGVVGEKPDISAFMSSVHI